MDLGGTTRMIRRDDVRYVQAQGDYARLHTEEASYLVRVPMADLERQWADAGFLRIHRSYLVALEPPHPHPARPRRARPSPSARPSCRSAAGSCRPCARSSRRRRSGRGHDAGPGHGAPRTRRRRQRHDRAALHAEQRRRGSVRRARGLARHPLARGRGRNPTPDSSSSARSSGPSCGWASWSRRASCWSCCAFPLAARAGPRPGGLHHCRRAASTGCCWVSASTRVISLSAAVRAGRRPERGPLPGLARTEERVNPASAGGVRRRLARHGAHRFLRAAGLAHHGRLLRGVPHGQAVVERLGDRRRVPLRRVLPRRRRAHPALRHGCAVVSRWATRPAT